MTPRRPHYTILGATGFIGAALRAHLQACDLGCDAPARDEDLSERSLGHVIYCIGLTADFRRRPFDTVRAHVSVLNDVLERGRFDSLLYLSSTRVYSGSTRGDEDAPLTVAPQDPDDLYNLTKLTGESLCLASGRPGTRVARLSNVFGDDFGSDNFLPSLVREAVDAGTIRLRGSRDHLRDYVALADVVGLLPHIAISGTHDIYNVASGRAVSNGAILDSLASCTGCEVVVTGEAPEVAMPPISVERLRREFGSVPAGLPANLQPTVEAYRAGRA